MSLSLMVDEQSPEPHSWLKSIRQGATLRSKPSAHQDEYLEYIMAHRHEVLSDAVNWVNYLPRDIVDQREQSVCVPICTSLMKTCHLKGEVQFDADWNYRQREQPDRKGMCTSNSLDIALRRGCIPTTECGQEESVLKTVAKQHRFTAILRIRSVPGAKMALDLGSLVIVVLPVFNSSARFWVQRGPHERCLGAHAVLLVGFSNHIESFLLRNSWSAQWANRGYTDFPYADWSYVLEAWTAFSDEATAECVHQYMKHRRDSATTSSRVSRTPSHTPHKENAAVQKQARAHTKPRHRKKTRSLLSHAPTYMTPDALLGTSATSTGHTDSWFSWRTLAKALYYLVCNEASQCGGIDPGPRLQIK